VERDSQRHARSVRRRALLGGTLAVLIVMLLLGSYLYDQGRTDLIAPGVTVAGIQVGGLRADAARARLRAELGAVRARPITVRSGTLRFALTGRQARLTANVDQAVSDAIRASRGGWFVGRAIRGLFGGGVDARIAMPVSYSRSAVDLFVNRVEQTLDRPARDASVSVAGSAQLVTVAGEPGRVMDASALRARIERALTTPSAPPVVTAPVRSVAPRVTTAMLAAEYPAYIVVDRPAFKLYLYQHLSLTHTYGIAVGRAGLETPAGLHHILDKQVNPAWHVPLSSWAGSLAGQVIPPGPQDPLVARWMGIDDQGDGIHGTNEPWSIGSAASHGCIRMLVPDVIQLYSLTPLGTPVYVV